MSVTYKIKADGSGYTKTVNRLRGDTQKFSGDVKSQMMGVGTAIKGAFAYVGINAFKGVMDDITELSRLARTIGDDFDGFQTITNAARQFGLEAETVADAIKDLDVKMTDGAMGAKAYAEVFELVGISLDEAMGMTQLERFYAFADAVKAADGQISSFSADEINDAMFRMVPLLELGADGIKNLGNEYVKFSETQRKMAETGSLAWDNLMHNLSFAVATAARYVIPFFQTLAEVVIGTLGELAIQSSLFMKGMKATFTGDFAGAKAAFSTMGEMATTALSRISDDIADVWKDADAAANKVGNKGSSVETKGSKDNRSALEKELNKQLEEQEKRRQAIMSDEEKLLDLQKRRIEAEKELGELGEKLFKDGATDEESLKLAEAQTKWEKLQTEELAQQLKVEKQISEAKAISNKEAEALVKAQKEDRLKEEAEKKRAEEKLTSTQDEIAAERKEREEIGMSDEDILARRKAELREKQVDLGGDRGFGGDINQDGKVNTADKQITADKELDIENLKTEIKNLEQGDGSQGSQGSQASVITSQLASIGGGGATASFTNDPILSENKRQSNLLEQLVKLQGGTLEGGGGLVIPEL